MRLTRNSGRTIRTLTLILFVLGAAAVAGDPDQASLSWPQWRGPQMTGVALHADPPVEWSDTKNIQWKVEIPGKGSSSPIVWGDRVYVTTAIPTEKMGKKEAPKAEEPSAETGPPRPIDISQLPERIRNRLAGMSEEEQKQFLERMRNRRGGRGRGPRGIQPEYVHKFVLYAIDRATGEIVWERVAREALPHEGTHPTGTWASNSPVTDGEHVWAYFGSRGLYCYDMDGELVWKKDFGDMRKRLGFGEGASPALHGDRLVVSWDHEDESFITALDKRTGKELWRTAREEITSWATPLIVEHGGSTQVITNATGKVRSYDLESGEIVWEVSGMTMNTIPTPVHDGGMVYLTSGFRGNALLAIDLSKAKGDITGTDAVVWSLDRDTPYTPSPLLYDGTLYFLKRNNGILSVFDAKTGKSIFGPQRMEEVPNIYASPVAAAGRVYITGREGAVIVLEHGSEYKVLSVNQLDDGFDASPAIVGNEIYLRGKYLYKISAD